jgi:3-oxoacyl-[acyl-carrier-protein] synthase II
MSRHAVVSGMGAVSCFGHGCAALWAGIAEGRSGSRPIERFATDGFAVKHAALVPDATHANDFERCVAYGIAAGREALSEARLRERPVAPARLALVLGTSPGDDTELVHHTTEAIASALGVGGPRLTVSTACSSSTNALGLGLELLRSGEADAVLAGGSDVLTSLLFAGFNALGVLSEAECAPFSHELGTVLGEGAGFCVLEPEGLARARGASVRARLLGYGLSCDAFHETSPDPTGGGVARGLVAALADAGLEPARVDYVNAHGTGTKQNDPAEWRAIGKALGEKAPDTPVSSTKGALGHAQAAAGVLELVTTLLAMERGVLPQTLNFRGARPNAPVDPVGQPTPRPAVYDCALSTNSAFAGANAAVAVSSPRFSPPPREVNPRAVWVRGVAALGPFGDASMLDGAASGAAGGTPELARSVQSVDGASLDRSSRMLLAVAQTALAEAGLVRPRGEARDRSGLVLGITRVSPESIRALRASIEQRGLPLLSATAFARMVLNAPAGTCARVEGLRGPMSTLSAGRGSGLLALTYAALLVAGGHAETMLGAAVDEEQRLSPDEDAGACAWLSAAPSAGGCVRVRASGIAAPERLDDAVAVALARADLDAAALDLVIGDVRPAIASGDRFVDVAAFGAHGLSVPSALAWVAGVRRLVRREVERVLIVSGTSASATAAAILTWEAT